MTTTTRSRKALAALLSLSVLAGGFAAVTTAADANPIWKIPVWKTPFPKPFPQPWPHPYPGPHFGYGPALFGGLALGAIAASAAAAEDCPVVRRVMVDSDGNEYIRRIRVCD